MIACPSLVAALWSHYETWRDNGFKDIDADGGVLRPRPSRSRMRRVKDADYGARMSLLNDYKHGSTAHAERKP
jgi:hypothetical protein